MNEISTNKNYDLGSITYGNITKGDIQNLIKLIKNELKTHTLNNEGHFHLKLDRLARTKLLFNDNGSLKSCYITTSSHYFKGREAISFNSNCFIGFAGWASDCNRAPFHKAFEKWILETNKKLENENN